MYNYRIDAIDSQIRSLEAQKALMQQPTPTINNYVTAQPQRQYDFNGLWANGIEEAKRISNSNLPTIIMDKNESKFYMKNMDGSFKVYEFKEVEDNKQDEIESLKTQMSALNSMLERLLEEKQPNSSANEKVAQNAPKVAKKVNVNESAI